MAATVRDTRTCELMKLYVMSAILFFCSTTSIYAQDVLTWKDCLDQARKNNPNLISSQEAVREQEAGKAITARGQFPQINADLGISRDQTKKNTYSYGVSASQLVFDGFKTQNQVRSASENVNAARQVYRFTSTQVRFDLRSAFINMLKAQELLNVSNEIFRIRKNSLVLITLRYESGLEHKGAFLTAQANMQQANFGRSQAVRNMELFRRQLNKEMGRRELPPFTVTGDFSVQDTVPEKPDLDSIAKNVPSVLEAAARTNAALFDIKAAYGSFAPELLGTTGAGKTGSHWPPNGDQWDFGFNLTMPIFDSGLRKAQVSQSQALFRQAQANQKDAFDTAIVDLEQAWASLQDALETVEVRRQALQAATERSKIAEAQYSTGFMTFDNWIIIENDLVNAKTAYLEAQANALFAEAGWIRAKGETLEYAQ